MKKVLSSMLAFTLAMASFTVPYMAGDNMIESSAASELSGELGGFEQELVDQCEVKTHIYVESKLISINEASQQQSISVIVNGADMQYCFARLNVYYDSRLTITRDSSGNPDVKPGSAMASLTPRAIKEDANVSADGMKGVILENSGTSNDGRDGVLWTLTFTLPNDAKPGDVYPFDIYYKSNDGNYKGVFTSKKNDIYGQLMQAYTFTRGINNGVTNSFNPETDVLDINGNVIHGIVNSCPAVANVDAGVDGVLAILNDGTATTPTTIKSTTTTTTETTTTTTETTTTTTTETTTTTTEPTTTTTETTTTTTTTEPTTTTTETTTTTTTTEPTTTTTETTTTTTTTEPTTTTTETTTTTTTTEPTTTTTETTTTTTTTEPTTTTTETTTTTTTTEPTTTITETTTTESIIPTTETTTTTITMTTTTTTTTTESTTTTTTTQPAKKFGDIDGSGIVDASDASCLLAYYAYTSTGGKDGLDKFLYLTDVSTYPKAPSGKFGDIDGNGIVDASDASCLLAYYAYTSTGGTKSLEEFLSSDL